MTNIFVTKRDGRIQNLHPGKMKASITRLCFELNTDVVNSIMITKQVIDDLHCNVTTEELTKIIANKAVAAAYTTHDNDYGLLAGRIIVSNLHKKTKKQFSIVMNDLYATFQEHGGIKTRMISDYHQNIIQENSSRLNSIINHNLDYSYNYFDINILLESYLLKINDKIVERPQHMLLRVAICINGTDIDAAIETYNFLSKKYFTYASPTLFLAATPKPQLSSCFLLTINDDSIEGIYETIEQCVQIAITGGDIGLSIQSIRAKGSYVAGSNSISNGLLPMLRVFNNTARHVYQGGNKPSASFTVYLEPWHADIFDFINLHKNDSAEHTLARDLFYGLWIPDLFMQRVEADKDWSLMCPHNCPGLVDSYGQEFDELYKKYEEQGVFVRKVRARDVWFAIIESQIETGMPYMLYKDSCNQKSNQQNLGTIHCANFSTEIVQYSDKNEIAVCNLASIALNAFVRVDKKKFNFVKLKMVTKLLTNNLNKIIDINNYPREEARNSNEQHRPIGIGVQGLADAFILMGYPYESEQAQLLNKQIFETIYYGALEASCELAEEFGTYDTYEGSPVSKGILQYDMWNVTPTELWDWQELKSKIAEHGVRNSLLIALMKEGSSTAQILGNNENWLDCNYVFNQYLIKDLIKLNLWNDYMRTNIIDNHCSIQTIEKIPKELRDLYKTNYEISVKTQMNMAADRGAFIDQSESFNIYVDEPNYGKITSIHFYGWKLGLKTGMYNLETQTKGNSNVDQNYISSGSSDDNCISSED